MDYAMEHLVSFLVLVSVSMLINNKRHTLLLMQLGMHHMSVKISVLIFKCQSNFF